MPRTKNRKYAKITVEIHGRQVRKSIGYKTLAEYEEKKKKILKEVEEENSIKYKKIAEEWQDNHEKEIQIYTADCYKAPLKNTIDEFGEYSLYNITPDMIQRFLDKMVQQGYAKQTVKLRRIVLKQVFDYGIFNGYIQYNPVQVCKVSKKAPQHTRQLPDDNDITIIKKNYDSEIGLYCNILIYTGLRREEVLGLMYEDFDYQKNLIRVNKTVVFENNIGRIRNGMKSEAGERYVPLLDPLKALIPETNKKGLIFCRGDRPIKKGEFDKGYNAYRKQNGISCTSHQMRHYFCTLCFDAGLDEKDLQEIMGHSKIEMSKDVYTHIRKERKTMSTNKLNNFILEQSVHTSVHNEP